MQALMRSARVRVAALVTSGALAIGLAAAPAASAQQQGLVNVDISNVNVLNHSPITATIPINAAANICGVTVAVLTDELQNPPVMCNAGANQQFAITPVG